MKNMSFNIQNYYKELLYEDLKITIYLINGEKHEINKIENILYEDDDAVRYFIPENSFSTDILIFKSQIIKIVRD